MRKLSNSQLVVLPVFLVLALAIVAITPAVRKDDTPQKTITSGSSQTAARPISSANASAADIELAHLIDQAIDTGELASARWGVFVMSLRDGRTLYSRDGGKLFTPASNMKIYTTAVALDLLGADYRWRTSVYAQAQPDINGTIKGDLTLYGRGAPDLVSQRKENEPSLAKLADDIYAQGVRRVTGNIIGDESYFRGNSFGDGWLWNDIQWYFGAEASALSIDSNEIDLTITPASKTGKPATVGLNKSGNYFHILNNVATVDGSTVPSVGINRGVSDNELIVWGEFPAGGKGFGARLSVYNPALWAATLFKEALAARGITIDGEPRSRNYRVVASERFDPRQSIELAAVTSGTLAEIVRETNKKSINLNAELILRTLGKERGAMAPDPDQHKMRERGDDEAALAIIRGWLERAGIPTNNLALHDGSGLSRLDLVTPQATALLLVAVSRTSAASTFRSSLPVAGKDGTLAFRMKASGERITAKTGSLTYDNALSGYITTPAGEDLAFSIICNDSTHGSDSISVIDKIGTILAGQTPADGRKAPVK
ncbi:MAG: D-alanyl-D-alanine carboxypeptidase/D-alanyl-D-alanine-endopeptidase [Pyrinomonadaceae bacterium]